MAFNSAISTARRERFKSLTTLMDTSMDERVVQIIRIVVSTICLKNLWFQLLVLTLDQTGRLLLLLFRWHE